MNNFQIALILIGCIIVGIIIFLEVSRRRQIEEESNWMDIRGDNFDDEIIARRTIPNPMHDEVVIKEKLKDHTPPSSPGQKKPEFGEIEEYLKNSEQDNNQKRPGNDVLNDEELMTKHSEIFVITVMAKGEDMFEGPDLLREFISLNLKPDKDGYYHRLMPGMNDVFLFGAANIMRPGYFKPNDMLNFKTKGVLMYMRLPTKLDSIQAFDQFYETVHNLAVNLGGEICDENRNRLSQYRLEQMREKVRNIALKVDLARKKSLKKASG